MSDTEVLEYLVSHAPLDRFYLFTPPGTDDTLMKYIDSTGKPWNIMEDDDELVARAVTFLKATGVKVFEDFSALLQYEQQFRQSEN
jgi:hypothetical protein